MKKVLVLLAALTTMAIAPSSGAAVEVTAHINGGGNGSWDPLDTTEASQFGFGSKGVDLFSDGTASGQFQCIMAGRSEFPLFQMMAVHGTVTSGAITGTDAVTGLDTAVISGFGTLYGNMDGPGRTDKFDIFFTVELKEGNAVPGPTQGTLRLSGGPNPFGDPTLPGAPFFTFPIEYVTSGSISIHLTPNVS
jgi:hypothetical protein